MAYKCYWDNKTQDALEIINWSIDLFPNDDNLYDSRGEFFESLGNFKKAKASYLMALNVLKRKISTLDSVTYVNKESFYRENYNRVKEK